MIPYFELTAISVGPLRIHVFGVLLGIAIVSARWRIQRRAQTSGVDAGAMSSLCLVMLVCGFIGAHFVKTVLPNVAAFAADPTIVLRSTRGIASLGGLGGGLLGGVIWCISRGATGAVTLRRMDIIAYTLPLSWMIGRLGCALVHDHKGLWTRSPLAVRFPEGARYDLGLIEFLFLICLAAIFRLLDRREREAGFFFGLYGVVYGLFRIWLDTLHEQPLRFLGGATAVLIGVCGWVAMRSIAANVSRPVLEPDISTSDVQDSRLLS
jgi:phosphatidylglycerol:prolipoprotein diacylglycerol transferase